MTVIMRYNELLKENIINHMDYDIVKELSENIYEKI